MEEQIISLLNKYKLKNVVCYDLTNKTPLIKKIFIASFSNDKNIRKVVYDLKTELEQQIKKPFFIDGEFSKDWILLDCEDYTIELFSEEKREYYNLEKLWGDLKPKLSKLKVKKSKK